MSQSVSDVLRIMRLAIGRRNVNDPDSNDPTLTKYIENFAQFTMSDDVKIFEQWGTKKFDITIGEDEYLLSALSGGTFVNYTMEAFISLKEPEDNSVSWNRLDIYQNPGEFYGYWGINNKEILIQGYPTQMLYYDSKFVFRTVPNDTYVVNIYGYKETAPPGDATIGQDYWLRYLAYGAALDYARDYAFDAGRLAQIENTYNKERSLLLIRTHNQQKYNRCIPRF